MDDFKKARKKIAGQDGSNTGIDCNCVRDKKARRSMPKELINRRARRRLNSEGT